MKKATPLKVWILRAIPFLLIAVAALAFANYYVHKKYSHLLNDADGDCIFVDPASDALRFRANCSMLLHYPNGYDETFRTNEIGVRDRPLSEFPGGEIVLLGDSHVEGFRLEPDQMIGRRLEARGESFFGRKILSVGIRSLGAIAEVGLLKEKLPSLKPTGLLWLINENDLSDDLLIASGLRSNPFFSLLASHAKSAPRSSTYLMGLRMLTHTLELKLSSAEYSTPKAARAFCDNLLAVRNVFPPGLPVTVLAIPQGVSTRRLDYYGVGIDREAFTDALECARSAGLSVVDLRGEFDSLGRFLIGGNNHLNAEGTDRLAEMILRRLTADEAERKKWQGNRLERARKSR